MTRSSTILQIVPRAPGTHDGVGDYAFTLAQKLRERYSCKTVFAAAVGEADSFPSKLTDFDVVSLASLGRDHSEQKFQHIILHYVNYGYQKRGIPFALLSILRELRRRCPGHFVTIFHELYASGLPWKSAFWLRPFQMAIARKISQISDASVVSSNAMLTRLGTLTPNANIRVHPVFSNFGEPLLSSDQIANRSPQRWAICGGTVLVERSLRSFRKAIDRLPENFSPSELFVIGGTDNPVTRLLLASLPNIHTEYHPQITSLEASQILASCAFAWLDYFHRADVPMDVVLKSGAFAAACAHAVTPVFPHNGCAIGIADDPLPGPYFVDADRVNLPHDRTKVAAEIYAWYQRHVSSEHLVRGIAHLLGCEMTALQT